MKKFPVAKQKFLHRITSAEKICFPEESGKFCAVQKIPLKKLSAQQEFSWKLLLE
jgi:hypothetical protein